jgi:hypothetical protein
MILSAECESHLIEFVNYVNCISKYSYYGYCFSSALESYTGSGNEKFWKIPPDFLANGISLMLMLHFLFQSHMHY